MKLHHASPNHTSFQTLLTCISHILFYSLFMTSLVSAQNLRVMVQGVGEGTITSKTTGISCGADCDETYTIGDTVILRAGPIFGSTFLRWEGDLTGSTNDDTLFITGNHAVRAVFGLTDTIPVMTDFTPEGIRTYLDTNRQVNTPARFLAALPREFRQNWIMMPRSESLQTGTAKHPRLLLPSADAEAVFTIGMAKDTSYPGSHPNAIEYMQWDPAQKNFRLHEIVVNFIDTMGVVLPRLRGVSIDDKKCSKCHSTRNVFNRSPFRGTTGSPVRVPPNEVSPHKNKPNWDPYDSWAGMLPFNRDRIYQGTVEAASLRTLLNYWTWRNDNSIQPIIEQLELQPAGVSIAEAITRISGGPNDGHIRYGFDTSIVSIEPPPTSTGVGNDSSIVTKYAFNGQAGTGNADTVIRGGNFLTLHHTFSSGSDEGRGVRMFDKLGGLFGDLNQQRVADELRTHRYATGGVPIDIRPIVLAIVKSQFRTGRGRGPLRIDTTANEVKSNVAGVTLDSGIRFFTNRGMSIKDLILDTKKRLVSLPRRKADIQRITLDRTNDEYIVAPTNGLIQEYGARTDQGTNVSLERIKQEVFRRPLEVFEGDQSVLDGIYVDREEYSVNNDRMALFRYFLEPLGVSVDKWNMGVRGRSRGYNMADVITGYLSEMRLVMTADLRTDPYPGLTDPTNDSLLVVAINDIISNLPSENGMPTFTDIQRIFNKHCIECHGGLDYPPVSNYGTRLNFAEDEDPITGDERLSRSYRDALSVTTTNPATSSLYRRLIDLSEDCPYGMMPCGGPPLTRADIETVRRWVAGTPSRPYSHGDPHIRTIDGINYDFQDAGEFTLLRDVDFEIQARHTAIETAAPFGPNAHTGLTTCVSINTAVAIKIGKDRITLQPNSDRELNPQGLQLRINGELEILSKEGIALSSSGRVIPTSAPGGIQVEGQGGLVIVITPGWWSTHQLWFLHIDMQGVRATEGLMGSVPPGSWLPAMPDGSSVGEIPKDLTTRFDVLYRKFGEAWRVNDDTSLFDYANNTTTRDFTIDNWMSANNPDFCIVDEGSEVTPDFPEPITLEAATEICSDIKDVARKANCIADVIATREPVFADSYRSADKIMNNNPPSPPILILPVDFATDLNGTVRFSWELSSDEDQDSLKYFHYVWHVDDTPNNNDAIVLSAETDNGMLGKRSWLLYGFLALLAIFSLYIMGLRQLKHWIFVLLLLLLALFYLLQNSEDKSQAQNTESTIALEPGEAYFWRVIVEDSQGARVESETRRFEMGM